MQKSERTREKIVERTIALIRESGGDPDRVTIRKIAERSQVSAGLVSHYFESKDRLIEHCVQAIIGGVIVSFMPSAPEGDGIERLKSAAKQVMDFLMENRQISRISILGDLANPKEADNTMGTVRGFAGSLSGTGPAREDILNAFMLTAVLQESFLRKDVLKANLGVDFYDKPARDAYIDGIVGKLAGRAGD